MDVKRLRVVTIVAPIAFLIVLEAISVFLFTHLFGGNSVLRLVVVFAILMSAVIPFSRWVFGTLERNQRDVVELNTQLQGRVSELAAANRAVERRNRELDAINAAIVSVSGNLELSNVLQDITNAARELVGSKYAALGVADEQGRITQFITAGISMEERVRIGPLPQGHGLLGVLITERKPLRVRRIADHPQSHGFPANHPPMTSLLGVPILYQGRALGDLYLTDKVGAEEFTVEDQEQLLLLANHAAVAIENARLYEQVREARDRLQRWNEELEEKVAERTREIARYSKELTTRVLQAQEEERKRIARELHDDTAQSLSTLLINLDLLEPFFEGNSPVLEQGFERVRTLAQRTLDEVRAMSHTLRPTILDDFGLIAALRWYADEYERTFGVRVLVDAEELPEDRLPPEVETHIFRIAQEALTNSGKHAGATEARVVLTFPDTTARLEVADNGKGFDPESPVQPTNKGGLGLYGMRERAELLHADLRIDSVPGEGTRVTVDVPL